MFNLKAQDTSILSDSGYEFDVVDAAGRTTEAKITVRGPDSPKVRAFTHKMMNQVNTAKAQLKRRGKDPEELTDQMREMYEDMGVESALVRIISWKGFADADGKEIPFTLENARPYMGEGFSWLQKQVIENSENISNFIKN